MCVLLVVSYCSLNFYCPNTQTIHYRWQRTRNDPWTPDKAKQCSTRAWQGQIRVWRRALHKYDPPNQDGSSLFTAEEAALCHM